MSLVLPLPIKGPMKVLPVLGSKVVLPGYEPPVTVQPGVGGAIEASLLSSYTPPSGVAVMTVIWMGLCVGKAVGLAVGITVGC